MGSVISHSLMGKLMRVSTKMTKSMVLVFSFGIILLLKDAMKVGGQMVNKTAMV